MIAINDYIALKGRSGSSRGADLIRIALADNYEIAVLRPEREPRNRVMRLAAMVAWDRWRAVAWARRAGAELIVHAANTGGSGRGVRSVVVMYDTMVLDHAKMFDPRFVAYARASFGHAIRHSAAVVTSSEHSRRRIIARWPEANVFVIRLPIARELAVNVVQGLAVRRPRALVVASVDKHKRLPLALEVVGRLRSLGYEFELDLVVRAGNDQAALDAALKRHDPHGTWVELHSSVSDEELARLYRTARMLLVPSIDEGYCLPAVEAARCGTPVVHADRGALREVYPDGYGIAFADGESDVEKLFARARLLMDDSAWDLAHGRAPALDTVPSPDQFGADWRALVDQVLR